ncbi:hypothetical protein MLD52_20875 [Puniceicoccaceae bacterium K14]|nr:hypothetical protein [Puniceicoccaceae bacterium K14]
MYEINLKEGEKVLFTPVTLGETDLEIEAIDIGEENHHLFGLSKKTERLPGHQNFFEDQKGKKWQSILSE